MTAEKFIAVGACRSAEKFARKVYENLQSSGELEERLHWIPVENIDFADSLIRPKIANLGEYHDILLNSNIILFQSTQNPFAKDPAKYAAKFVVDYVLQKDPTDAELTKFLEEVLETSVHSSGIKRGYVRIPYIDKERNTLKEKVIRDLRQIFQEHVKTAKQLENAMYMFVERRYKIQKGVAAQVRHAINDIVTQNSHLYERVRAYLSDIAQPRYAPSELFEFASTAFNLRRQGGAHRIIGAFTFPEAGRSDRFNKGELDISRYLAYWFKLSHVKSLVFVRRHSEMQVERYESEGITIHEFALGKSLSRVIAYDFKEGEFKKYDLANGVIIAPDEGSGHIADAYSDHIYEITGIRLPVTKMKKKRPHEQAISDLAIHEGYGMDDPAKLKGKFALLFDDMVDTFGTGVTNLGLLVGDYGMEFALMVSEHPVCSPPAIDNLVRSHQSGQLKKLYFTNTIDQPEISALPFVYCYHIEGQYASFLGERIKSGELFDFKK